METVDEEFLDATIELHRARRTGTRSRSSSGSIRAACTSGRASNRESQGKTGLGIYPDGMVEHDGQVGQLLKKLDDLGIADNTIVIYTTDNGAEAFSWPDGGTTPFRGEKNTNWEGGYRVPALVRWPGLVPPRTEINDIFSAEDWVHDPGRRGRRAGHQEQASCRATTPPARPSRCTSTATTSATCWPARVRASAANSFTGPTTATSPDFATTNGRSCFMEQKAHGLKCGRSRWLQLRLPKLFNLRSDPFERAQHEAGDYVRWFVEHAFVLVPAQVDRGPAPA